MSNPDLLILGAGPAGIAVSSLMSAKGYSCEIIDAAFFPRPKICGEFLNPQAVLWIEQHGFLPSLLQLNPHRIYGMKITDLEGRSFTGHYVSGDNPRGFTVLRKDFDALMVAKIRESGAILSEGFKAERLIFDGDKVTGVSGTDPRGVHFEKRAKIIIGADGRNNLVGRTFGWMRAIRNLRKYVFLSYFEKIPETSGFGEVHLVKNGYVGIAPLTGTLANVALVVDETACPSSKDDRKEFFLRRLLESPLKDRFLGLEPVAPVISAGPLGFEMQRNSGFGTMLVGDTCGFIDPFTGEGMNYAFISAEIASDVLHKAFQVNDFSDSFLELYDNKRKAALGKKVLLSKMLQKAIERPQISSLLVRRFAASLSLGDTVVSAVGCAIPVEEVWNLRFLLRVALGRG